MSRESLVFLLGFVVFLTPFLGILWETKKIVFIVCGVLLMILGYLLRRAAFLRSIETESGERASDAFVENQSVETQNDE